MAWQVLSSEITIGNYRFAGVHEVRIKRSLHSYADMATIKLPSIGSVQDATIIANGLKPKGDPYAVTTAHLFSYREPVTIKLGYNGDLQTEFQGFVRRCNLNMPLEVECEGYVQQLRLNVDISGNLAKTSVSKLLALITAKCPDISVYVTPGCDLPFINVKLQPHSNGADILNKIKELSQGMLNIFFINPTTLWCGLTYTPYAGNTDPFGVGMVNYRLGYNVVKDNSLKERVVEGEPVTIIMGGILATGQKIQTVSQYKYAQNKVKTLINNVGDIATLQALATEKQYQANYAGYEGAIVPFLVPFCLPGYQANITDDRYPERNGVYLIESTDVTYGVNGARRTVEIGPKIGFDPTPTS